MRITNNMMISNLMLSLQNNLKTMSVTQQMWATGKKFILPSDDPIAMSKSLRLNTDIAENEQYKKNCQDAISWLDITEDSIDKIQSVLKTCYERATQMANGTYTDDNTKQTAAEIAELKKQIINSGNATYAGRYLFSGFKADKPLLNEDGTYNVTVGKSMSGVSAASVGVNLPNDGSLRFTLDQKKYSTISTSTMIETVITTVASLPYDSGTAFSTLINDINTGSVTPTYIMYTIDHKTNPPTTSAPEQVVSSASITALATTVKASLPATVKISDYGISANMLFNPLSKQYNLVINSRMDNSKDSDSLKQQVGTVRDIPSGSVGISLTSQPEDIEYKVGIADTIKVNTLGTDIFGTGVKNGEPKLLDDIQKFIDALNMDTGDGEKTPTVPLDAAMQSKLGLSSTATQEDVNEAWKKQVANNKQVKNDMLKGAIQDIQDNLDNISMMRAQLGAKSSRAELTLNRIEDENVNFNKLLSDNEDVDMEKVIMDLTAQQNVYQGSLSVGARIIQKSLMDFIN